MQAEQLKKITGYFIEEAKEHLETIGNGLTNLQSTIDDSESVTEVYRAAHSIKGGAAMLELESIRRTAHRLEDYFKLMKETPVRADDRLQSLLHPILNGLQTLVAELEQSYSIAPEVENQVMPELEPLFTQTQSHLDELVLLGAGGIESSPASIGKVMANQSNEQDAIAADSGLDFDEFLETATTQTDDLPPSLPEVGVSELDTLADLFEGESFDLEKALREEEVELAGSSAIAEPSLGESPAANEDEGEGEFSDLLDRLMDSSESGEIAASPAASSDEFDFLEDLAAETPDRSASDTVPDLTGSFDSLNNLFGDDFSFEDGNLSGRNQDETPELELNSLPDSNGRPIEDFSEDLNDLFSSLEGGEMNALLDAPETEATNASEVESSPDPAVETAETSGNLDELFELPDSPAESASEADELNLNSGVAEQASAASEVPFVNLFDLESDQLTSFQSEESSPSPDLASSPQSASDLEDLLDIGNLSESPEAESAGDLEALLADVAQPEEKVESDRSHPATPPQTEPLSDREPQINYYPRIDELEQLLETSPSEERNGSKLFTRLERLLETSPDVRANSADVPDTSDTLLDEIAPPTEKGKASSGNAEDEFGDLEELLKDIEQKVGGPPSTMGDRKARKARARTTKAKVEQTLKVPVRQMDNLSNLMGELVVNRNSLEGDEDKLRQSLDTLMHQVQNLSDVGGRMQDLYERSLLEDALLKSRQEYRSKYGSAEHPMLASNNSAEQTGGYDVLEMDSFTKFHELAQEVIEMIVRVRESASDIALWVDDVDHVARTLRQVTSQLQEGLTKARMIPFARTADRLPLAVRKICPQLGKQAQLQVEGRDTLIDKMILEHLSDPLTHLVNNALTHGIESPEDRIARGKPPAGQIVVRALQQGNQTAISVSDDGAGIDPVRVKAKAIKKGVITPAQSQQLAELEVYDLLFNAGFSTKDEADNFAGRGVGLDVVRTSIMEIRGNVSIESKLGKGTTFTIRLPLTLSICKALCCVSENAPMAFPMDGVEDMLDMPLDRIRTSSDGNQYIVWREQKLNYCRLCHLLSYNRKLGRGNIYAGQRDDSMVSVVVLRSATNFLAIGVDRVLGEQEIVIKQINGPVPKTAGIAGATVQGDGRIMAIADVLELIQISEGRMRKDPNSLWQESRQPAEPTSESKEAEPTVLIVDDSVTVRSLLSMSFEKSGYQVEQARDGQDAWEKLRGGLPCNLIFCDIEMPRVDGLELLGRLQKDEHLCRIPIAMLTSRGAERHRRVAAELGASAYFTKPYVEQDLLEAAQRMIEGAVLLPDSTRPQLPPPTPSTTAVPQPLEPEPLDARMPPKVLIIDDSVTVRSLLSMTFENAGYEVAQARDGQDAWDQLKGGLECDIAFCDIEMPKMDGLELLHRIQKDETLKEIPVAMLTSRGAKKMQERAAERGASAYFTKPYVEQELLDAADQLRSGEVLLEGSTREPRATQPTELRPEFAVQPEDPPTLVIDDKLAPPRVLIVDDSVTVRSLLSMTFENAGYDVFQARDGQDAWEQLSSGLEVDVALLDIEMPKMDGLTLLSKLQEDERLQQLPAAMLTSRGAKKMKQRAAEIGARGYFVKPYVEDVLLEGAKRLMQGEVLLQF